ncbi:hypothetical protein TNCV_2527861 [Trichonephila clavipes]|nr:hypothetical protein TNCV_2527861 [Trichonephila clavipes]
MITPFYIALVQMAHVDALSRIQVLTNQCNDSIVHRIKESQELDPHILSIKAILQNGPYDNYCIKNNILYKFIDGAEVLVIPDEMQHHFIKNAHDKGHFSVKRTLEHIKNKYFIPQLQSKIEKYISNCVTCILKNQKSGKQEGFLHPLVKDDIPLNTYHIDHLGPLATSSKNYKFILAVIDSFTKFVWLYPTKTTSTSEVIKKLDIQKTTFGNPRFLITDRGTTFTSDEFRTYCSNKNYTSPYYYRRAFKYYDTASGQRNYDRPPTMDNPASLIERHFISHIPPTPAKRELIRQCKVFVQKRMTMEKDKEGNTILVE